MTTKPLRVQKPAAEVIGSFENVMRCGERDDGRSLFVFRTNNTETFVFAASELQAWKVLHAQLGTIEKMTKGKMSQRWRQEALKLMDERGVEPTGTEDPK